MFDETTRFKLRQKVDDYCATYRHPNLAPFTFHELDLRNGWWRSERSRKAGCYALFTAAGDLLYIGKASLRASIGSRLAAHFVKTLEWVGGVTHLQMIEVVDAFEAPSLEEYLIRELQPRFNLHGLKRS